MEPILNSMTSATVELVRPRWLTCHPTASPFTRQTSCLRRDAVNALSSMSWFPSRAMTGPPEALLAPLNHISMGRPVVAAPGIAAPWHVVVCNPPRFTSVVIHPGTATSVINLMQAPVEITGSSNPVLMMVRCTCACAVPARSNAPSVPSTNNPRRVTVLGWQRSTAFISFALSLVFKPTGNARTPCHSTLAAASADESRGARFDRSDQ